MNDTDLTDEAFYLDEADERSEALTQEAAELEEVINELL